LRPSWRLHHAESYRHLVYEPHASRAGLARRDCSGLPRAVTGRLLETPLGAYQCLSSDIAGGVSALTLEDPSASAEAQRSPAWCRLRDALASPKISDPEERDSSCVGGRQVFGLMACTSKTTFCAPRPTIRGSQRSSITTWLPIRLIVAPSLLT
jgi:hypothetical protein